MDKFWLNKSFYIKKFWPYIISSLILLFFLGINLLLIIFFLFIILIIISYKYSYLDKLHTCMVNVTITITAIFITVVLIEAYLHIVRPNFLEIQPKNSRTGELIDFTSRGYLDNSVFNKDKNVFRILGLGDSFAIYLRWINKNYHNFLQTNFDLSCGKNKIEIINAGMEATGPGYNWHILNKYGDLLKPDLILVGFFVGNSFNKMDFDTIDLGELIWERRDPIERFLGYFRFKYFWLYKYFYRRRVWMLEKRQKEKELSEGVIKRDEGVSKENFLRLERDRIWICDRNKRSDLVKLWDAKSNLMLNFKEWGRKRNIKVVFVIFPDEFQVNSDLFQEILKKYAISEESIDLHFPNTLLLNFCNHHDLYCLDMLEQFQENAKSKQLYIPRDTHWNAEGNKLAADIIFNYLEKNNLVKVKKSDHVTDSLIFGNIPSINTLRK